MSEEHLDIAAQMDREARRLQCINDRRRYVDGCGLCIHIEIDHHGEGPWHDASPRCESGFDYHCTCSTCW